MSNIDLIECYVFVLRRIVRYEILLKENGEAMLEVARMKSRARDEGIERESAVSQECREDVLCESVADYAFMRKFAKRPSRGTRQRILTDASSPCKLSMSKQQSSFKC